MATSSVYVGIDVSRARLDAALSDGGTTWSVPNSAPGIQRLVTQLQAHAPTLVVMEATGGYEMPAAAGLAANGLPVVIVDLLQVRDFAKATGQLAKTDQTDAHVLAMFAARVQPPVRPLPDEAARALDATVARRRQIIEMLTAEKNRLGVARAPVRKGIQKHIRWLEQQLAEVDHDLDTRIRSGSVWRTTNDLVHAVPGVGPNRARTLIAELPELGRISHKEIAALVGVAPFARDSGTLRGKRMIWGGRAPVRSALYMSVRSAARWNPVIRGFYERLRAREKPTRVAQAACMRKLLTILKAMVRDTRSWDPAIPIEQLRAQHSC